MDESDHLTLVNAGDEEVVSQEEGERDSEGGGRRRGRRRRVLLRERYRYLTHAGTQGGSPLAFGGCTFLPFSLGPTGC